jgi:hypothetical protein
VAAGDDEGGTQWPLHAAAVPGPSRGQRGAAGGEPPPPPVSFCMSPPKNPPSSPPAGLARPARVARGCAPPRDSLGGSTFLGGVACLGAA